MHLEGEHFSVMSGCVCCCGKVGDQFITHVVLWVLILTMIRPPGKSAVGYGRVTTCKKFLALLVVELLERLVDNRSYALPA